jgi:hypothetical protein
MTTSTTVTEHAVHVQPVSTTKCNYRRYEQIKSVKDISKAGRRSTASSHMNGYQTSDKKVSPLALVLTSGTSVCSSYFRGRQKKLRIPYDFGSMKGSTVLCL